MFNKKNITYIKLLIRSSRHIFPKINSASFSTVISPQNSFTSSTLIIARIVPARKHAFALHNTSRSEFNNLINTLWK